MSTKACLRNDPERVRVIMLAVFLVVSMLHFGAGTVTGWPTVSLPGPGNGVLIGTTTLYEEPDFLGVSKPIDYYLGVPYAKPPIGELRFADPLPLEIQGEYNASYDRAECMQPGILVSEDCLFLTIYTPSPKVSAGCKYLTHKQN